MNGLGQVQTIDGVSVPMTGWASWLFWGAIGFIVGSTLLAKPTEYYDEHGHKISKKEYDRIERGE